MQWQEIDRINARSSKQFVAFLIVATVLMGLTLVVFKRSILAPLPHWDRQRMPLALVTMKLRP